jgi:hypothetical protein
LRFLLESAGVIPGSRLTGSFGSLRLNFFLISIYMPLTLPLTAFPTKYRKKMHFFFDKYIQA